MHNVETHLAEIGQKCNTRLLEKRTKNFRTWQEEVDKPRLAYIMVYANSSLLTSMLADSANYALTSQLSILRSCPDVLSRIFKSGGSVLLAAKVLVISRLLHSKISKRPTPPPYLETLRNRLATLRRKLLTRIDRSLKILDASKDALLEAMCAFVLATSSSPTDVVRHFHHLRLEAIEECIGEDSKQQDSMLQALRLYVRTLRDSQAVVPGQMAHALESLKVVSIFKSQDLRSLIELNIDVHERWIDDDIKTFTPYIRNDDLSRAEAERLLRQWARPAFLRFLYGLRVRIQDVQDPLKLMGLRKEVLELWLSQNQHSLGIDSAETLDGLRDVFNNQAVSIIRKRASALDGVGIMAYRNVEDWREGQSDMNPSLWDVSTISIDVGNGGKQVCDTITDRLQGKNEPLRRVSLEYTQWLDSISSIELTIKSLRETKWEDAMDDVDDDDDLLNDKQVLLSEDDPRLLQEELASALKEAYARIEASLEPVRLLHDQPAIGTQGVFLLRVWRELRQRTPGSYCNVQLGLSAIPNIESIVIESSLKAPLRSCSKRLHKAAQRSGFTARSLWEGIPELPVTPSPWAYRLLLEVVLSMLELGVDIWSPHLSAELKKGLAKGVSDLLRKKQLGVETSDERTTLNVNGHGAISNTNGETIEIDGENTGTDDEAKNIPNGDEDRDEVTSNILNGAYTNGDGDHEAASDRTKAKDLKIQRLFDVLYLGHASSTASSKGKNNNELDEVQASLKADVELEPKSLDRLSRNAGDYWKRTKLLFALLGS